MILMLAMLIQAEALSMECSQSFASRRHRPNQPNVRSITHRRGKTSKPFATSQRLMISIVQSPFPLSAVWSFSPAYPPSFARQAMQSIAECLSNNVG
jgi:predicted acyl esterase